MRADDTTFDLEDLRRLLDEHGYSSSEIGEAPGAKGNAVLAVRVGDSDDEARAMWQFLRSQRDRTGRWPMISSISHPHVWQVLPFTVDEVSATPQRWSLHHYGSGGYDPGFDPFPPPADTDEAHELELDEEEDEWDDDEEGEGFDPIPRYAQAIRDWGSSIEAVFGTSPTLDEAEAAVLPDGRPPRTPVERDWWCDRWLRQNVDEQRIIEHYAVPRRARIGYHPLDVVLLPDHRPESAALLGFGQMQGNERQYRERASYLIKRLQGWNDRFGAEPFASLGAGLYFQVKQPPTTLDSARRLMFEHVEVCGYRGFALIKDSYELTNQPEWTLFYDHEADL